MAYLLSFLVWNTYVLVKCDHHIGRTTATGINGLNLSPPSEVQSGYMWLATTQQTSCVVCNYPGCYLHCISST
ncbi:hypothetical protein EDB84DRAFT_1487021 [Lactarius hengduanensis]|nr:hypothetical protein EDB84DRAFT_1487021 [Lactarius hengduanensis]